MNYLLFNNEIFLSDGINVHRIDKNDNLKDIVEPIEEANICVVDVDIIIAAAMENPVEKKDSLLVRKFKELYQHEAYIIQDERIDDNLFQVIGIKEQRVREVYTFISPEKVESFIPYGIALRNTLINKKVDLNKSIVFVDDFGTERLVTVFDGLKFSRTRVITNNGEDILPEIKRSQIDFFKKNEEHLSKKNTDFVILVNNQALANEIAKYEEKLSIEYFNVPYPALEGLKEVDTLIKYVLPEEILKRRREIEIKKNVVTAVFAIAVTAIGLFYFIITKFEWEHVSHRYDYLKMINERLVEQLRLIDRQTYREDIRRHKILNYGVAYLSVIDLIPPSYEIDSFKFIKSNHWDLEMTLLAESGEIFEPIPKLRILKSADIKDIFVNNQQEKLLRITL